MPKICHSDPSRIRLRELALNNAIERQCSPKWILRQWSRFIRERDLYRCVCCDSEDGIQAHHIVRKTLYPWGATETGNGITLCSECHRRVHEKSNGRPDLSAPLSEADDQDEWAFLFGLAFDDAQRRGLDQDHFYFLPDHMLKFFVNIQGYEDLYGMVMRGEISRIRFAHEICRVMPEVWYSNLVAEAIAANL
ncbi:HNH endonuclease [Dyella sp.]|uniref:HNH endonuclease n=1 Tax=Dyella sp. TaxID=1869338 RepID=UPI003F8042AA